MAATVAIRAPRLNLAGLLARGAVWLALAAALVAVGVAGPNWAGYGTEAALYVLVGLSVNVILGYTGQISLGHQGLVGAGALFAAYVSAVAGLPFPFAVVIGAVSGAVFALGIGFVALRISGLYLALVTLVVGVTLQESLFDAAGLTGGGAGQPANRPAVLLDSGNARYYFLCVGLVALFYYLDVRLIKSKAGRAFLAIKADERVAAADGINVVGYKLLAFVLSGFVAGTAGALLAFKSQEFVGSDYSFQLALLFVVMTVVGGAGSRYGVAVGSALLGLLHTAIAGFGPFKSFAGLFPAATGANILQFGPDFIAAMLLILTLVFNPGGLAQQLSPFVRWLRGGPLLAPGTRRGAPVPVEGSRVRP
jgi:branched-chain amino acid transport system permease protein